MGAVYIPLIPLAAIRFCFILQRLPYPLSHQKNHGRHAYQRITFLLGLMPLISSLSSTSYISWRAGLAQGKSDF